MLKVLIKEWWFLMLRGVLALLFAAIGFSVRGLVRDPLIGDLAQVGVIVYFALFAGAAGLITIVAALRGFRSEKWWLLLLDGIAAIISGAVVMLVPDLSFNDLLRLMALWAAVIGIIECVAATHVRRHLKDEWLLAVSGVGSLAFSVGLFVGWPANAWVLLMWMNCFALFSGIVMISLSLRLRSHKLHRTISVLS